MSYIDTHMRARALALQIIADAHANNTTRATRRAQNERKDHPMSYTIANPATNTITITDDPDLALDLLTEGIEALVSAETGEPATIYTHMRARELALRIIADAHESQASSNDDDDRPFVAEIAIS